MARLGNSTASTASAATASKRSGSKPERKDRTARRSGEASRKNTRERSGKTRDRGERSSNKRVDLNITVSMQLADETKNKFKYVELDDGGDPVENPFRDGKIGQIYLPKSELGSKPAKTIQVTITEE